MDELTGFEQQLAAALVRQAGPTRPVDAMAVGLRARSVVVPRRWPLRSLPSPRDTPGISTWRSPIMTSAARVLAAIAIITLGTGAMFLAASPGPSPATATPSPVMWTPPPGLVTTELAPGVSLATDDGAGHRLRYEGGIPDSDFAFAPDGSLWLLHDTELIRVGDGGVYPAPTGGFDKADLTAAADGTLWALALGTVASFRGSTWTYAPWLPSGTWTALEVQTDGTVWARNTTTLGRFDGDAWTTFAIEDDQGPIHGYAYTFPGDLALTPDGSVWVAICGDFGGEAVREQLLRFDGSSFQPASPTIAGARCLAPIVTGRGGELWAFVVNDPPALARYDGTAWVVSGPDAGVPSIAAPGGYVGVMAVAPDGRLWAAGPADGRGSVVGVYDGRTWSDAYVSDGQDNDQRPTFEERPIKVAPDGTVWLLTDDGFLIIQPEVAIVKG